MHAPVVVVGSLNADLVFSAERLPAPGETVAGTGFAMHPGGKGANQAVAAARLGARVRLVGAVGDDANGRLLLDAATAAGVDVSSVRRAGGVATGAAGITVDAQGENTIVVIPGANGVLSPEDVASASAAFDGAGAFCLCLEIPMPTVLAAARAGRAAGAVVILNLSPYMPVPDAIAACVDVLLVNDREAAGLLGLADLDVDRLDWRETAAALGRAGFGRAVVTLGARGAVLLDSAAAEPVVRIEATAVRAVDTTGAGDAFTGALAARLAAGDVLVDAARYASVAAALATTRPGAQSAYPSAGQVDAHRALGRLP